MKRGDKVMWNTRKPEFGNRTRINIPAVVLSATTNRSGWSSIAILDGDKADGRRAVEARTSELKPRDSFVPLLDKQ
jgi:hypothetical protein